MICAAGAQSSLIGLANLDAAQNRARIAAASGGLLLAIIASGMIVGEADDEGIEVASADALELGRWLADNGHPQAALVLFRRVIAQEPTGETAAWGHLGAGYVQVQFLGRRTAAYQHFHEAIDCDPAGEAASRARRALDQMGGL